MYFISFYESSRCIKEKFVGIKRSIVRRLHKYNGFLEEAKFY
jgi:hypothetical protein